MNAALHDHFAEQLRGIDELMRAGFEFWPWPHRDRMRALVERQLARKGKRLRSLFALMCGDLLGGTPEKVQPLAASVELYHAASLVVDDVQDNAHFRDREQAVHVSENVSNTINLASIVRSCSHYPLHEDSLTLAEKDGVRRQLDMMATLVPLGQSMDIGWHQGWYDFRSVPYEELIRLKTGAPFACVAAGAAVISGKDSGTLAEMERLGYRVGVLYQLVDDYNDMFLQDQATVPSDLGQGKFTRPVAILIELLCANNREDLAAQVASRLRKLDLGGPQWILELMSAHSIAALLEEEIRNRAADIEQDVAALSSGGRDATDRMTEFVRSLTAMVGKQPQTGHVKHGRALGAVGG
ncbi:octaprenyl-diphosphate synthase [Streptomyces sp. LBL]|uniref:polyprenyl synthetase family protein n=1 Tax=Streptomyces sp. LBL TaxID=2940562 RepID=UPI00247701BB|nr:polyprenyl synthetase family protein [Streptomyces sp. LBL]MDH6629911.1 octaprenyl-diphosphate synthase [Streptomyces sp. LBL]